MEITERQHRQLLRHMRQEQGLAGRPPSSTGQVGHTICITIYPSLSVHQKLGSVS